MICDYNCDYNLVRPCMHRSFQKLVKEENLFTTPANKQKVAECLKTLTCNQSSEFKFRYF